MGQGGGDDEFDELVLDDDFVRAGRPEPSALERQASLHPRTADAGGRREETGPILPPRPRRRVRHRLRLTLALLAVTLGALVLVAWTGENRAGADRSNLSGGPQTVSAVPAPPPQRLSVLPPDPGGEGGFAFLDVQDDDATAPVAFDPCRPVTYVVRRAGEPAGGDAVVEEAVAEVSLATGLQFVRGPDTTEAPSVAREGELPELYGPGPAPVLLAWSDETATPDLAGDVAGVAGPVGGRTSAAGSHRWLSGQVVLDAQDLSRLLRAPGGSGLVKATVLHELGHLVGLAHVPDPSQLMHSESGEQTVFSAGDLRGLRALGSGACFTDW